MIYIATIFPHMVRDKNIFHKQGYIGNTSSHHMRGKEEFVRNIKHLSKNLKISTISESNFSNFFRCRGPLSILTLRNTISTSLKINSDLHSYYAYPIRSLDIVIHALLYFPYFLGCHFLGLVVLLGCSYWFVNYTYFHTRPEIIVSSENGDIHCCRKITLREGSSQNSLVYSLHTF